MAHKCIGVGCVHCLADRELNRKRLTELRNQEYDRQVKYWMEQGLSRSDAENEAARYMFEQDYLHSQ